MSDVLQSSRPTQDIDPTAIKDYDPLTSPLTYESYAIGQLLDEVRIEPGLGRNERLLASAMCLEAIDYDQQVFELSEIDDLSPLSKAATLQSVQKLTMAGFISVLRPVRSKSASTMVLYQLQFPYECTVY
ncbi:hypothetical protein ACVIW2_003577 [Bradyrhizobium huanghuaihaiense]